MIAQIKQQPIDSWVDFGCQIKEVKEIKQRTKSNLSKTPGQQYNVQKLIVQDDTDAISIWAYATQQFLPNQIITVHGMLKEYKDARYLDYCDVKPAGQNTPQDTPPASQNAPQSTKALDVGDNDVEIRKSVVCAYIAARHRPEIKEVEHWMKYIQSGIDPDAAQYKANPNYVGDDPPPTGDGDIPF